MYDVMIEGASDDPLTMITLNNGDDDNASYPLSAVSR